MKNIKHSQKRDEILNTIRSTKAHPSAEWIYNQLKPKIPDLSLATVYRNIALFREQGLVRLIATVNAQERFDANTQPHTHFICDNCGAVIDIDCGLPPGDMISQIEKNYQFTVSGHSLVFYGLCGQCK